MAVHLATLHVVLANHQRTDVYMLPAANGGKKELATNSTYRRATSAVSHVYEAVPQKRYSVQLFSYKLNFDITT
jgi:hypothetical protein